MIYKELLVIGLGLQGSVNYRRESGQPPQPPETCREDVSFFLSAENWLSNFFESCRVYIGVKTVPPAHPNFSAELF